jgi:hypothetical protein
MPPGRPVPKLILMSEERETLERWLVRHPRYHLHYTPTGSSWINLVERWFATLTERQLRRGVHRSTPELEAALRRYVETYNQDPKPFVRTKTADEILAAVARFCNRTSDSGHYVRKRQRARPIQPHTLWELHPITGFKMVPGTACP